MIKGLKFKSFKGATLTLQKKMIDKNILYIFQQISIIWT
jgi:hypothetical protein